MSRLLYIFLVLFLVGNPSWGAISNWAVGAEWAEKQRPGDSEVDQKQLPPLVSQDTFGICSAAAASTVLNFEMCKQGKIQDCQKLPDSKKVSALGIARYTADQKQDASSDEDKSYDKIKIGSSGSRVLSVASNMASLPTEECSSLMKIASKIPVDDKTDATRAQEAIWKDLEANYNGYRKAVNEKCDDCASKYYMTAVETAGKGLKLEDDQMVDPNLRKDNIRVLEAFKQDTWEKALNTLLYPQKCSENGIKIPGQENFTFQQYPEGNVKGIGPKQIISQIKSILLTKKPVIVDRICVEDCESTPKYHSTVIAGYRKICSKTDPTNCREALRVINSYGAGWQKYKNDGWVDASSLVKNVKITTGTLSWLGDM